MPNHTLERRPARLQVGPRQIQRRHRAGTPRLRLRHVRARHLAHRKPVLRRLQVARQNRHVVLAQRQDRLVAHHVHVGRHALQQHGRLRRAQRLPARAHRRLRRRHRVLGPEAPEDRLHRPDLIAARVALRGRVDARPPSPRRLLLVAGVGRPRDRRPVARQRARHLLVGGPLDGARRIQPRIELVGRSQRLVQSLSPRRTRPQPPRAPPAPMPEHPHPPHETANGQARGSLLCQASTVSTPHPPVLCVERARSSYRCTTGSTVRRRRRRLLISCTQFPQDTHTRLR